VPPVILIFSGMEVSLENFTPCYLGQFQSERNHFKTLTELSLTILSAFFASTCFEFLSDINTKRGDQGVRALFPQGLFSHWTLIKDKAFLSSTLTTRMLCTF
jgi:hypothetical protein